MCDTQFQNPGERGCGKRKRLVWLSVNSSYSHSSLALPLLHAASADVAGWDWDALETTAEADCAEIASELAERNADLLCATLYLFNRNVVLEILERFHALMPECRVAVGGPECLGEGAEEILKNYPFIGLAFRGEGEGVFPAFLARFDLYPVRAVIPAEGSAVFEEWESASPPVGDPFFRVDKPFVQMETSRGCPMGCIYCTSCHTKVRCKSPDSVRKELTMLRGRGVSEIRLLDRTFNFPPKRGAELLRIFRTEFPDLRFHLEIHPGFLDGELRQELLSALPGRLHIEAGIQCLGGNVQEAIGRGGEPEEALEGLRFLCGCPNFETHADLLAGLPEQTSESIFRDVASLMAAGPAEIQLEVLKVLPGTPLRARAEALGIVYAPRTPYDVMRTAAMSGKEILRIRLLSRLLDLTYNHSALHPVICSAREEDPEFLPALLEFFLRNGLELKRLFDLKKRFLMLSEFFSAKNFQKTRIDLAFQWILAGYPPGSGPGKAAEKTDAVPENAVLLFGESAARKERDTKFWLLRRTQDTVYLAFNRKYAFNRPAAVWREDLPAQGKMRENA